MLTDLLAIEGHLSILLSELPEELSPEATSSLLGALLRLRRVISRETTKTPPTGLLEPLEQALADIESCTHTLLPHVHGHSGYCSRCATAGVVEGYTGALRYVEAAHATMTNTLQEGTTAHATR